MSNINEIKRLFRRLKVMHPLWKKGDDKYKQRLVENLEPDLAKLEKLGVARHFSEALLFYGMEFLEKEYGRSVNRKEATIADAEAIFGAKSRKMTKKEIKAAEIAKKHGLIAYEMVEKDGKIGVKKPTISKKS